MIGEMRDSTSFTAAMSAADTGHLVLSTVHTTNASQSVVVFSVSSKRKSENRFGASLPIPYTPSFVSAWSRPSPAA